MNEITQLTRNLRKNQTESECRIWAEIRNKKLGVKFRRQHPITYLHNNVSYFFIADFACIEKKLIIEIDGNVHEKTKDHDLAREYIIQYLGFSIIRFSNDAILNRLEHVKEIIKNEIIRL